MTDRESPSWLSRWQSPLLLSVAALVISFGQRPFKVYNDTRIEMITAPGRFLGRLPDLWTSTIDLGHIQSSQFVGFLFPQGPFFALGDFLGMPLWIVQRIWFAALLTMAGWGVVRLIDAMYTPRLRGAGFLAGLLYIASPFVMISLNRGSVWLVPYAALPWALLWTKRGIDSPRGWKAPAAIALLLAFTADATVALVAWVVIGMAILAVFEALTGPGLKSTISFAWRTALLSAAAALWWLIPTAAQAKFGSDYLTFTEHAESILRTPSASESLRLLGYWVGYVKVFPGSGAQFPAIAPYLASPFVIAASFFVPLLAIASFAIIRRWRYGVFFALMLALAVLAMSAGFPKETFVGRAVYDLYYAAGPFQFIRTTYKAAPLAGLALVSLAGVGIASVWRVLCGLNLEINGRRINRGISLSIAGFAVVALVLLWGRPLWAGNAINPAGFFDKVPKPWVDAVKFSTKTAPENTRIAILPGSTFSDYSWGNAQMSVAPGLTDRPVLIRQIVRSSSTDAAQLLEVTDNLLQQGRLMPGQLNPLLRLMGVGQVLVGTDASPVRNEEVDPARVEAQLQTQIGFHKPIASFGPPMLFAPPGDRGGESFTLPQVRAYSAPLPATPGIKRVQVSDAPVVLDGDASGVLSMAAVGSLDPGRALFYSGSLTHASLSKLNADRPTLVFSDSNRRTLVIPSLLTANTGPTLSANEPVARVFPVYDPFPAVGPAGRTVAVNDGFSLLYAPISEGNAFNRARRPSAAFDGDPSTAWMTEQRNPAEQYLEITLRQPRVLRSIYLQPHREGISITNSASVSVNGGPARTHRLNRGWNEVPIGNAKVTKLRITPQTRKGFLGRARGGFDEIRIPGSSGRESLLMPSHLAALSAGMNLDSSRFEIIVERQMADFSRQAGKPAEGPASNNPLDAVDPERSINRIVTLPAGRSFVADGWASVSPTASDAAIDSLVGMTGPAIFTSSQRFEGTPENRASSAFDGLTSTAWKTEMNLDHQPWIQWQGNRAVTISRFKLISDPGRFLVPTRITINGGQGNFYAAVRRDGQVNLPQPITTNRLRITIGDARPRKRQNPNSRHNTRAVAISEIRIPGVPTVQVPRSGRFESDCGALTAASNARSIPLAVTGSVVDLDAGRSLTAKQCSDQTLRLNRGVNQLAAPAGSIFTSDYLRLTGAPPKPVTQPVRRAVMDADGKVLLDGSGWLVLAESYSPGWSATCKDQQGRSKDLGSPVEIDGFANGWKINGSQCTSAKFTFGAQTAANISYMVSLLTFIGLVILLLIFWNRNRRNRDKPEQSDHLDTDVVISSRSNPHLIINSSAPTSAKLSRLSRATGWLSASSAGFVVATAILYLVNPEPGSDPINFDFPYHHLSAHWTALTAIVLLLAAVVVQIIDLRRSRDHAG